MNLIGLWIKFQLEEDRKKAIREALESTSTEDLTKAWDGWDCSSTMLPAVPIASELDIYIELRKRGVERCYC